MIEIILAALATYAVSILVSDYDGPSNVLSQMRSKFAVFRCAPCLSVWVAIPIAILIGIGFVEYLAVVGGVIIMERMA